MALKRIYTGRDAMEAHFLRGLLEDRQIKAVVTGEALSMVAGAIPISETAPIVWVDEQDIAAAREIVRKFQENTLMPAIEPPWVCPACGESLEGQFAECWNCMTPRPDVAPEPDDAPGLGQFTLQDDFACMRCGYNLRGLVPTSRCPECGLSAMRSLAYWMNKDEVTRSADLRRAMQRMFATVAAETGFAPSGLILMFHALAEDLNSAEPLRLTPQQVCDRVREFAIEYFAGEADAQSGLSRWGINNASDIARAVGELNRLGILSLQIEGPADAWAGAELFPPTQS
jgi:hypothetical protein